jgi:hypothetical protein
VSFILKLGQSGVSTNYIKIKIYFKIDMFYFNQFLHNLSNQFFKNFTLITLKGIRVNYLYVYQTNFFLKMSHMKKITFHNDMKPHDTKRQVTTPKK